jgi:hypothetical protein
MRGSYRNGRAPRTGFASLQTHIVLDRLHAADGPGNLDRLALRGLRAHESAQLNDALERLDIDFSGLERRFIEYGRLDLGGDDRVVDAKNRGELQSPHQEQDKYDYQYDADDATGTVTPAAGVRPGGNDADEHQDQDNQQNGAKTHGSCSLFCRVLLAAVVGGFRAPQ